MAHAHADGAMVMHGSHSVPLSLLLYLQSAPVQVTWNAFVQDCAARGLPLYSSAAQRFAASLFINHPCSRKYPTRSSSLKALLKLYITAIDNYQSTPRHPHHYSTYASYAHSYDGALSPIDDSSRRGGRRGGGDFDEYDAYEDSNSDEDDRRSGSGNGESPCFACESSPRYASEDAASPTSAGVRGSPYRPDHDDDDDDDPVRLELMQKYIELSIRTSKDTDAEFCFKTFYNSFDRLVVPRACGRDMEGKRSIANDGTGRFLSRSGWQQRSAEMGHHSHDAVERGGGVVDAVHLFSSVRVSSLQYQNVGLALWPAALVLVQLLAQELQGHTRLFLDAVCRMPGSADGHAKSSTSNSNSSSNSNSNSSSEDNAGGYGGVEPRHCRPSGHGSACASDANRHGGSRRKKHDSHARAHKASRPLRILELGAGVGLTPVMLRTLPEYAQRVSSYMLTDYESVLLSNMAFNLGINGMPVTVDESCEDVVEGGGHIAHGGGEGSGDSEPALSGVSAFFACSSMHKRRKHDHRHRHSGRLHRAHHHHQQQHIIAKLDWCDTCVQRQLLQRWPCNVVLASDCIYDVSCIPQLVSVIRTCLTYRADESMAVEDGAAGVALCGDDSVRAGNANGGVSVDEEDHHRPKRVAVVVQTHRQNSTMKLFFDAVRAFAQVRSYSVVTNVSHRDRHSCALGRHAGADEVVPLQGSCAGGAGESRSSDSDDEHRACSGVGAACARGEANCVSNLCHTFPYLQPDEVLDDGSLRSMYATGVEHNDKPQQQQHIVRDDKINGSHASTEANAKLQDTMLGPFYVSMAGLIGVHILTLKTSWPQTAPS